MFSPVKIWRNQKKVKKLLGQQGHIVSFTKIYVPPSTFENQAPYAVVVVKLNNGQTTLAQLVDYEQDNLYIGQRVKTILRKTRDPGTEGVIPYGVKFKPI